MNCCPLQGALPPGANTSSLPLCFATVITVMLPQRRNNNKNSSGDEIANVNFFTTTWYNSLKYNPLLNIQHDAGRGAASGCGLVVLVRRFSHAPICGNEVRF